MTPDISRWSMAEMMEYAARGAGKVAWFGMRGTTLVTQIEIDAMACALIASGMTPVRPGSVPPASQIPMSEGERA